MAKLKEEVVDNFSNNFLKLQLEIDNLHRASKLDNVENLLKEQHVGP